MKVGQIKKGGHDRCGVSSAARKAEKRAAHRAARRSNNPRVTRGYAG